MKKFTLSLLLLALPAIIVLAQNSMTVCHTSSTDKFATFASNKAFNASHPSPRAYIHKSEVGKMVRFKTTDGTDGNAYLLAAKKQTNNWVFVFQEWWGLNDNIKREAERLYTDLGNVNVLAIDMFDGKIATTAETAGKYMQEFKQERGTTLIKGALAYAGRDAKVATIGWCFGGGISLQAALTCGKQAVACVVYYGMPEEDVNRLKTLNCDVLGIFATQDKFITSELVNKFEENMNIAGKNLSIKRYDADHAFANPSNPQYNKPFTEDAYKHTLAFLKPRLK